jgi:hypothetical protein
LLGFRSEARRKSSTACAKLYRRQRKHAETLNTCMHLPEDKKNKEVAPKHRFCPRTPSIATWMRCRTIPVVVMAAVVAVVVPIDKLLHAIQALEQEVQASDDVDQDSSQRARRRVPGLDPDQRKARVKHRYDGLRYG